MDCSAGKHKFELKGLSNNRRSYRFRCPRCGVRCVIWKSALKAALKRKTPVNPQGIRWIDRKES